MAGTDIVQFFSNAAAGTSAKFSARGGKYTFFARGTFGGGNILLQLIDPTGTAITVASSTLTAAGTVTLDLVPGQYQAVSTTGSGFYAWLCIVPYGVNF